MKKFLLLMLFLMIVAPVSVANANMITVESDSGYTARVGLMIVDADTSNQQEFLTSQSPTTLTFLMDASQNTAIVLHTQNTSGFDMFLGYIHGPSIICEIIDGTHKKKCPKKSELIITV